MGGCDHLVHSTSQEPFEVYLKLESLNGMQRVCKEALPNETIGLLVGSHNVSRGFHYTIVDGFLVGETKSSRISVEFESGAMGPLVAELRTRYPGSMLVGWFHSHPGYGCFLSHTDLVTQRSYFREEYHAALVIDPIKGVFDIFKLHDDSQGYRQCSFAVLDGTAGRVPR